MEILFVAVQFSNQTQLSIDATSLQLSSSPCSAGTATPRWVSRAAAGSGSGCGRRTGRCRSTAAPLRLYTLGRTPCGRPPPRPLPPLPPRPRLWPPTGYPPSPVGGEAYTHTWSRPRHRLNSFCAAGWARLLWLFFLRDNIRPFLQCLFVVLTYWDGESKRLPDHSFVVC